MPVLHIFRQLISRRVVNPSDPPAEMCNIRVSITCGFLDFGEGLHQFLQALHIAVLACCSGGSLQFVHLQATAPRPLLTCRVNNLLHCEDACAMHENWHVGSMNCGFVEVT